MKKILRIGSIKDGARLMDIFCKVELTDGKLSISGVEGPKSNGDCVGSCGQIDMHLRDQQDEIIPADGWDASKLRRFFEVWQEWHLNDMRPACNHQTGPEWTSKDVSIYHFRLTDEASKMQRNAKDAALCALKTGAPFTPTPEQSEMASLDYSLTHYEPNPPGKLGLYYRPKTPLYAGDTGASETKKTGWLSQDEHPEGFLSKPCPVCGYKYGSQWLREELPTDVVAFLQSLPETDKTPAWV